MTAAVFIGCQYPYDDRGGSRETGRRDGPPEPYSGSDPAVRAVYGILANPGDRRGIKWELERCDQEVRKDIVAALTEIVRAAYAP